MRFLPTGSVFLLALAIGLAAPGISRADEPPPDRDPGPDVVVHVPIDEMHVLLRADRRGVVLKHAEYERLLAEARAQARLRGAEPPSDGALLSAKGALDLSSPRDVRLTLSYEVEVLAERPSTVPFVVGNLALDDVSVDGEGHYEELDGKGRLRFVGPGRRRVAVVAYATPQRTGDHQLLDLQLPAAAAMALTLKLPPAVEGEARGEGPGVVFATPAEAAKTIHVRPDQHGRLKIAWGPASRSVEGPAVIDADTKSLHHLEDGLIRSKILVQVDVLRAPVTALTLGVPPDLALRAVGGKGVTGTVRSEDRSELVVEFDAPQRGRLALTLDAETPAPARPGVVMPSVTVPGAVRQTGEVALRFAPEMEVHGVHVEEGRRLASLRQKGQPSLLRYALARRGGRVLVDLEPGAVRLEASSTYYLNLTEPAQTLFAALTYRVVQGTAFRLAPQFPSEFALLSLKVNGRLDGFRLDERPDGTIEVSLDQGAREGSRITLLATLEQAAVDWVPDEGAIHVPFAVPSAGASREEAFVGVGADASFRVLDADVADLVAVGAAELTNRGVSPVGLVYGYRLDGDAPSVTLEVERRTPRIEAAIVTRAQPGPRRLAVETYVVHTVERAGVRRFLVDVPAWADEEHVRIHAADLVASSKVAEQPADVPGGYVRWEAVLGGRVLGRHVLVIRYHEDQDTDDWSVSAERPLAVRVPLDQVERSVIVSRAPGLEVALTGEAPEQDLAELPGDARVDPLTVRHVVRLEPGMNGPGIVVRKHDGAPVLEAIAPTVALRTAVALEGILRTRAEVRLVNVGLQFLRIALPADSELVGATVDDESVKPLVDPAGVLRIPIPPARRRGAETTVAFTYETRLGREATGDVAIPSPHFPDLEVLKTTHTVAFDPRFEIYGVNGDFGTGGRARPRAREPWLLGALLGGLAAPLAGSDRAVTGEATPAQAEADYGAPQTVAVPQADPTRASRPEGRYTTTSQAAQAAHAQDRSLVELQQERQRALQVLEAQQQELTAAGDLFRRDRTAEEVAVLREQLSRLRAEANRAPEAQHHRIPLPTVYEVVESEEGRRVVAVQPGSTRMEVVPPADPRLVPSNFTPPEEPPPAGAFAPGDAVARVPAPAPVAPGHGGPPPGQPGGPPDPREDAPTAGGEGPVPTPPRAPPRAKRKKGLLSLDVPVTLSRNTVRGERLGAGGTMVVSIVPGESGAARHALLGLTFFAVGLALASRRRRLAWLFPLVGGILLAVLVGLVFGRDASLVVVALVDALTALLIVLVLRWLVLRLVLRSRAGGTAKAATAAGLALLFLLPATAAFADEAQDVEAPRPVYVPYDPEDPEVPRADDRIFLPFDTYLHLRQVADPEADPEVLALGRVAALVGARHTLHVGAEEAEGSMKLRYAKRGDGLHLTPVRLGGVAVTEAVLDGKPVRLLLKDGAYQVPLAHEGEHTLAITYRAPVARSAEGRQVVLDVPPFAVAALDLAIDDFEGEVSVPGAGRVAPVVDVDGTARTEVHLGALSRIVVTCENPVGSEPEVALRTRAESHVVHSIRDSGTESRFQITLHVLQGKASHLDLAIPPEGVTVLRAAGAEVARWEAGDGRLRLVFAQPVETSATVQVHLSRAAGSPARAEELPALAVLDTTGERGHVVVNAHPFLRAEPRVTEGLLRTATPRDKASRGPDQIGRVAGAWHFAARPTRFVVQVEEAPEGLLLETVAAAAFGDDYVWSRFDGVLSIDARVPTGDLVFELPGDDEVRRVTSPGLATWWTEGEGEERTLHLRYAELRKGSVAIQLVMERRLGGKRDAVAVPRWRLRGARRDRGTLVLLSRPDLEPDPGRLPGLRSIPVTEAPRVPPPVDGAVPVRAFRWEEPLAGALPVTLRTPALEVEAVVVTAIEPGDEVQRLEHLVLFDVRRGATERFDVFVPDGGFAALDVVRTRDLREVRRRRLTRRDPGGQPVEGTLYEIRTQSPRGGIVEVTIAQLYAPDAPVRVIRPERVQGEDGVDRDVKGVQYFGLVRAFLDGDVETRVEGGEPVQTDLDDLPFLPSGIEKEDVWRVYAARAPYVLDVAAERRGLKAQSGAVVYASQADVVLGRDGQARVRVSYRLFNRSRQFLNVTLPSRSVLFGVTVAGRPVKPLRGRGGVLLIPVPKVPLGDKSYAVSLLYRAPAGAPLPARDLKVQLPQVQGAEVDRTVVRLYAPDGFDFDIESAMTETEAQDVAADLAEAAVYEAKQLIEVQKSGTLEQRSLAADNAALLVAEANDLNRRSGNKRKGLDRDVQQVTREFQDQFKAVVQDLEIAGRAAVGQQIDFYASNLASNAAPIVTAGAEEAQVVASVSRGVRAEGGAGAKWRFNPSRADQEGAEKQEIKQLKQRLGKALEERAKKEVQDFDMQVAQTEDARSLVMGDGTTVAPDATWMNFARLNDALTQSQYRNRQLGVVPRMQAQQQGQTFSYDYGVQLDDVTNGLEDLVIATEDGGGGGLTTGGALNPSAGVYFNDGEDGDFRGRTENVLSGFGFTTFGLQRFADANGDGFFTDRIPALGQAGGGGGRAGSGGYRGGATRTGLMGVDVSLPKGGKVYHFRALNAGAPIEITASRQGWSPFAKWALFVAVLAGLALLYGTVRLKLAERI